MPGGKAGLNGLGKLRGKYKRARQSVCESVTEQRGFKSAGVQSDPFTRSLNESERKKKKNRSLSFKLFYLMFNNKPVGSALSNGCLMRRGTELHFNVSICPGKRTNVLTQIQPT